MAGEQPLPRLLRAQHLPERLVRAVLEAAPAELSDQTARQLADVIGQWDVRDDDVPEALAAGWERDGGVPAELDRLRAMFRYRSARRSYRWSFASGETMRDSEDQLRSFWVTSGHDVADLDRYLAGVDAEFPDISAG